MVSELFEMLDSVRDQIGIVDWDMEMTTLEDDRNDICYDFNVSSLSLSVSVTLSLSPSLSVFLSVCPFLSLSLSPLELGFLNIVKMNCDLRLQVDRSLCPSWLLCSGCFRTPTTE